MGSYKNIMKKIEQIVIEAHERGFEEGWEACRHAMAKVCSSDTQAVAHFASSVERLKSRAFGKLSVRDQKILANSYLEIVRLVHRIGINGLSADLIKCTSLLHRKEKDDAKET